MAYVGNILAGGTVHSSNNPCNYLYYTQSNNENRKRQKIQKKKEE